MSSPRVSVVVTCFNLGEYLPETLASIHAQTFRDFEICIVDDGSTDSGTLEVLGELERSLSIVRSLNRGLPAARNLGVSRTTAEYVCAVDADDLLDPRLLEMSVSLLDSDPSLAFASHWLEAFGDETWDWTPERCDFPSLLVANTVNGAALVRRAALEAVGGWDEGMVDGCEDWDFWISLVERGYRGEIIPEILFRYRRRPDSMSRVKFAGGGHSRLYRRLVEKHAESFQRHLLELLVLRDASTAANRALADDIEERMDMEIAPALARARDDLAAAERRSARWETQRQVSDVRASRDELDDLRRSYEIEVLRLDKLRHRAEGDAAELRASWSWRLTRPLRTFGRMTGIGGRRT
jgi:glycosyltransferase involved in cell wall biosynthesis